MSKVTLHYGAHEYDALKVKALAHSGPKITVPDVELNAFRDGRLGVDADPGVYCTGPVEDVTALETGANIFVRQNGRYTLLLGRSNHIKTETDGQIVYRGEPLVGYLISGPQLKKARLTEIVTTVSPPVSEIRQDVAAARRRDHGHPSRQHVRHVSRSDR